MLTIPSEDLLLLLHVHTLRPALASREKSCAPECVYMCVCARARVPEADVRERVILEVTGHSRCRMAGPPNTLVPFVLRAELFSSATSSESAGRRAVAADQSASGGPAAHVLQQVQRLHPCPPEPDERRQPESYSTCFFFFFPLMTDSRSSAALSSYWDSRGS